MLKIKAMFSSVGKYEGIGHKTTSVTKSFTDKVPGSRPALFSRKDPATSAFLEILCNVSGKLLSKIPVNVSIYMFKANNGNTRTMCKIY